ncbi:hypothetical protein LMH73_011650 [Vibrio splendidus]|nr:hypothetical protein [Vibrio splendidus]MCC4883050.1 hypothetical protein [Vibrio splendidus]
MFSNNLANTVVYRNIGEDMVKNAPKSLSNIDSMKITKADMVNAAKKYASTAMIITGMLLIGVNMG